ncbi:MAG TPA: branched-chain amino acid ABC transporter permease/ATP-binding protein [Acidimicrobiales bacterium]|nr:branched-chain amino acid ABC transporter permease/ATP-binding protein [Acidimicrobiales bacterium]
MNSGAVVLGVLNGLTVGLLAAGLVLVFKSNRFLNLAHAQIGALPALLLAKFVLDSGWNFWVALIFALVLGIGTALVVDKALVAPLRRRTKSPLRLLLLSIGVSQLLLALTFIPGLNPDTSDYSVYPQPFDADVSLGGVRLTGMNILTAILVPALVAGLAVFLRYSLYGKQIRAAANNPDAARLCGISVARVSSITWALAGAFAAVSAVLQAPYQATFNGPSLGPYLLMLTLGAAAFGAFVSVPGALVGGLVLGLVAQVVSAETSSAAMSQLWVFGVILLTVAVRGRAIARVFELSGSAIEELPVTRVAESLRNQAFVRYQPLWLGGVTFLALAAWPKLPWFDSTADQFSLSLILIYALLGVSLTMLLGWGGQVSLGNFALVGLGAYLAARWSGDWTLLTLLLVVGAIGAGVMVLVGLPALRIRGLTLAVTTLGLAVISHDWLYHQSWITRNPFSTVLDAPDLGAALGTADTQLGVYYVCLVVLAAAVLMAAALRRSSPGRIFLAVRDNERASAAFGISPAAVKLALLAVSGFFSATGGVLWAFSWRAISVTQFTPEFSTAILAIPVIGGLGSISGAIAAAVLLYGMTFFVGPEVSGVFGELGQNLGFSLFIAGAGVVITVMQFPNGIAGEAQRRWQLYLDKRAARVETEQEGVDPSLPLTVQGVHVRFGGVVALDGPDIEVRPGEIVGLIGTNGAGKTTLMNVISGVITPDAGSVRVFGNEVTDLAPDFRAAFGMARSFQDAALFGGLTVRETIQVALSQRHKVGVLSAMVAAPWVRGTERRTRRTADDVIERFGLTAWADARTSDLSTGTRRICDLAAQVASEPKLILLDEPTAGVAQREAEAFGPLLREIRDELDCAVLIVEHDMPLLMGLCDRIYALELGSVIAEGSPEEIRNDQRVVASYLGTHDAAITRSGAVGATR